MKRGLQRTLAALTIALIVGEALPARADQTAQNGDLTHLIFTATTGLDAVLLSPQPGGTVPGDRAKVVVRTVEGAGVELAVDGAVVPASQIGERAVDAEEHTARYTFYSVPFHAGRNDVALTALGAHGLRGTTIHEVLYGAGDPVAVSPTLAGGLIADGRSSATLRVDAIDAAGRPARSASLVRVTVVSGDAAVEAINAKATSRSAESELNDAGSTTFRVVGGTTSGNVVIAIAAGDARATLNTFVAPFLRKPLVTGLISGGFGATPGDVAGDSQYDNGGSTRGRIALFASGEVLPGTSLVAAYDTASRLTPTAAAPYTIDPNQQPFQTYGDTSTTGDDALSYSRTYARLEHGRDSFTYGRFTGDIGGETSASSYSQVLSGSRLEVANTNDSLHAVAFSADNNIAYARATYPVTGLATIGETLNGNIVVGSDIITLVVTDRRTGAVIAQTPLVRNVDYTLDDVTGVLRFLTILLPFDANGNPQFVVVQYQYAGVTTAAKTLGGKVSAKVGATTVRVGYVNDVSGSGNFSLFEQGLTGPTRGGAWSFTHATADGAALGGDGSTSYGQSYRFALGTVVAGTTVKLGYDATGAGFQNPFGGYATPGLTDYLVTLSRAVGKNGEFSVNANGQRTSGTGTDSAQSQISALYKQHVGARLVVSGGAAVVAQSGYGSSTQAQLAASYRVGDRSTISLSRLADVGGAGSSSQPGQTAATLDFAVDQNTHAFVRETWFDAPQTAFDAASAEASNTAGASHLLQFGIDRKVGPSTAVTSEYTIDRTINGSDFYATSGVRETLNFGSHLKGDAFFQTSTVNGATTTTAAPATGTTTPATTTAAIGGGYTAYGISAAYATDGFHATTAFQNRAGANGGYTLQAGAGGALTADLSLLGTLDQALTGGIETSLARAGLAFRPANNDRGASLLEFDRSTDNLSDGTETANTVAFEEAYRPTNRLEVDARYAYKLDGDGYYAAHTELVDLRADQRIGKRADLAAETRTLLTPGISGATTTGFAIENGWRLGDQLRLAGGYNFSGTADPDLAVAPTRRGFYVTMTDVVSHVFGWGK